MTLTGDLCENCSDVTLYLPRQVIQYGELHGSRQLLREYKALADLEAGSNLGCALCVLLYACHRRSAGPNPATACTALRVYRVTRGKERHHFIKLECSHAYGWHSEQCLGVMPLTEALPNQWKASSSASSDHSFRLVHSWLMECVQNHSECRTTSLKALPSRVLKIGETDSAHPEMPKISLIKTNPKYRGHYAALSYCWGALEHIILTSKNIDQMRQDIDMESLPRTFQDAIFVCMNLGLQYLWIDALCILQDSKTDWQRESAKMGSIFGNSLLTIKASGASDSHGGCFLPRSPTELNPAKLRCWAPEFDSAKLALVFYQEVSTEREPLETRAWTLQEDLLSPRVLSYGKREMWWECNTVMKSDGGRQVIETHHVKGLPKPLRTTRPAAFPNHLPGELSAIKADWLFILREYGVRHLTFPEDRLPALSGIAKVFEASLPSDKYIAGLWRSDVPWNLLWHTAFPALPREGESRMPSWSWASMGKLQSDNYLMFDENVHPPPTCCSFIHSSLSYAPPTPANSEDVFSGKIISGKIIIRGPLLKVWRVLPASNDRGEQYLYRTKIGYEEDLRKDEEEQTRFREEKRLGIHGQSTLAFKYNRQGTFHVDYDARMVQSIGIAVETWLLFVVLKLLDECQGIVLDVQRGDDGGGDVKYRRIGTFVGGDWQSSDGEVSTVVVE